jgi:hypothetical protein
MNGEVRSKSGNIDVAAYETASLSRCNGKEVGKTLKPSAPSEKKAVYKQTLIICTSKRQMQIERSFLYLTL